MAVMWSVIFYTVAAVAAFYIILLRPVLKNQKDQRNAVRALQVGDEVVTTGGLIGEVKDIIQPATRIAFGPGVGRSPDLNETANWLYTQTPQPMVIDADGLNALSDRLEPLASPGGPRILTPHPGEFARLAKLAQPLDWDSQARLASEMAARFGVVIVLKGSRSLITNGTRNVRNLTGNPGMATGGSGDVLTGLITALVCQGLSPFDAAYLGCHVHGLAGDLAAEKFGQVSLIARDLIDFLPGAFRQLAASSGS